MKISKKELIKEHFKSKFNEENFFKYDQVIKSEKSYLENYEKLNLFIKVLDNLQINEF